jgi:hypothetical protein
MHIYTLEIINKMFIVRLLNLFAFSTNIVSWCNEFFSTTTADHLKFSKNSNREIGWMRRLWVFNTTLGPLCQSGCGYLTSDNNVNTPDGSARSYKNGSQGDS